MCSLVPRVPYKCYFQGFVITGITKGWTSGRRASGTQDRCFSRQTRRERQRAQILVYLGFRFRNTPSSPRSTHIRWRRKGRNPRFRNEQKEDIVRQVSKLHELQRDTPWVYDRRYIQWFTLDLQDVRKVIRSPNMEQRANEPVGGRTRSWSVLVPQP